MNRTALIQLVRDHMRAAARLRERLDYSHDSVAGCVVTSTDDDGEVREFVISISEKRSRR